MPITSVADLNAISTRILEISIRVRREILRFNKFDCELWNKANNNPVTEESDLRQFLLGHFG